MRWNQTTDLRLCRPNRGWHSKVPVIEPFRRQEQAVQKMTVTPIYTAGHHGEKGVANGVSHGRQILALDVWYRRERRFTIEMRKIYWVNTYNKELNHYILHHKVLMTIIDTVNKFIRHIILGVIFFSLSHLTKCPHHFLWVPPPPASIFFAWDYDSLLLVEWYEKR